MRDSRTPKDWKQMSLGEIFKSMPKGVDKEVLSVINGSGKDDEKTRQLRDIFGRHKDALAGIGIDSDYLAYVVIYQVVHDLKSQIAGGNGHAS